MKVLVTGHKGFIGKNVFFNLRLEGFEVDGIDCKDGDFVGSHEDFDKYDCIVHLSANLTKDFHINFETTQHIVERAKGKVIFASSAAVYGNTPVTGATEETPLNPFKEYGITKAMEEKLIQTLPLSTIFRFANVYGPYTDHGVIFGFACEDWAINGEGQHVRDFVHVDDIVPVIVRSVAGEGFEEGIYNLGSGVGTRMIELYKRLNPLRKPTYSDMATDEIEFSILNSNKAKAEGFKPRKLEI